MNEAIDEALSLARALPAEAVAAIFRRYAHPLEVALPPLAPDEPRAELFLDGKTAIVRAVNLRAQVDVIGNDWFVLEIHNEEPLAIAGPLFFAALSALSRRLSQSTE